MFNFPENDLNSLVWRYETYVKPGYPVRFYRHKMNGYYSVDLIEWIEKKYYLKNGTPSFDTINMLTAVEDEKMVNYLDTVYYSHQQNPQEAFKHQISSAPALL